MSNPTQSQAGAAQPVKVIAGGAKIGGLAIPVYGYATQPTDGRGVLGGPAIPVIVLTAADLIENGGTYELNGMPEAMPVITAPATQAVLGQDPIAVFPINSWTG